MTWTLERVEKLRQLRRRVTYITLDLQSLIQQVQTEAGYDELIEANEYLAQAEKSLCGALEPASTVGELAEALREFVEV